MDSVLRYFIFYKIKMVIKYADYTNVKFCDKKVK